MITYEENGFPVELTSDREIERAVRLGKLRPETVVKDYALDGSVRTLRAADVAALRALFERSDRAETVSDTAAPVAVEAVDQPPSVPPRVPMPPAAAVPPVEPVRESPAPAAHTARSRGRRRRGGTVWIIAIVLAVLAVAIWYGARTPQEPDARDSTAERAAAAPTDVIGTAQSYWATRAVTIRRQPAAAAEAVGTLHRGDTVRAVTVRGPDGKGRWVQIESGEFIGAYAWASNLADAEPPILETSFDAEPRRIVVARSIFAAPNFSAAELDTLPVGATVRVSGRTADGWWEIALKSGGVGYVPSDAIAAACVGADCRIVTPRGWGGIEAGMTSAAASAASGLTLTTTGHYDGVAEPAEDGTVACNVYDLVGGPQAVSVFVEHGKVTSVGIGGPGGAGFKTDRGVGIGDSEAALRRAYPKLEQKPDIYSEPPDKTLFFRDSGGMGLKFSIVGGKVAAIAAGGRSIEYVEGCL